MMTREEITKIQDSTHQMATGIMDIQINSNLVLCLEVLLDIRDLLKPISNEASSHLQAKQATPRL